MLFKFCKRGEISPNLVTLLSSEVCSSPFPFQVISNGQVKLENRGSMLLMASLDTYVWCVKYVLPLQNLKGVYQVSLNWAVSECHWALSEYHWANALKDWWAMNLKWWLYCTRLSFCIFAADYEWALNLLNFILQNICFRFFDYLYVKI